MAENMGVKDGESLSEDESKDKTASGGGDERLSESTDDRPIENVRAELKRKSEKLKEIEDELAAVREERETELGEKRERMQELQDKERLSEREKKEFETLEQQIAMIEADPRSKAWLSLNEKSAAKIAKNTSEREVLALDLILAEDLLEQFAEEMKQPVEKFEGALVKYMRKADPGATMKLVRRTRAAYKLMKEDKAYEARDAALKEREKPFAETGQRASRPQSKKEILESAKSDAGMVELLKAVHVGQEEEIRKRTGS